MQKRTSEVLKAIRWWIGMAAGLLVFFYLWSLVFKEDSFSWEEWGKRSCVEPSSGPYIGSIAGLRNRATQM